MNKTILYIVFFLIIIFGIFLLIPSQKNSPAEKNKTTNNTSPMTTAQATISTSKGEIVIDLYGQLAPKTVANFTSKAQSNFYNNLTIHRVEDWVVQGGDPAGNGTGGGTMATELNAQPFIIGSVGVARGNDIKISNDAQFFITKTEASWLNNQYTNFGQVSSGMEVANNLQIGDKILSITIQ